MSLDRGRSYGEAAGTLAGEHAAGAPGFSGMVPAGAELSTDPNAGGRYDELGGGMVITNPQRGSDFAPIAGVEDRPMLGGPRSAPHANLLRFGADYDGGRTIITHRVSVMVLEPTEQMVPFAAGELPSLRVPPVSDPLGRVCANARAAAGNE